MKIKKAIKKILVLGASALIGGATLGSAIAADLADYPGLFIKDGAFNGILVIGDDADAKDVIGVTDISTSLQWEISRGFSGGDSTIQTTGELYKIEKSSNKLNHGEAVSSVQTTSIDKDNLPTILADGKFRNKAGSEYEYEQKIDLGAYLYFAGFADSEYLDKMPVLGIRIPRNYNVLSYHLDFKKNAESSNSSGTMADFENRKISMLGHEYDIIDAQIESDDDTKLVLMKGSLETTMEEGETKTFTIEGKEYKVNVAIITDTGTQQVKFVINGETTDALTAGQTYKLQDGSQIGVREILANEAGDITQDIVEFYLGADKLTLINGENLRLSDDDVDDVSVRITRTDSSTKYKISDIYLDWTPEQDTFIAEYSSPIMPGTNSLKLIYTGLTTPTKELTKVINKGDRTIELSTQIKDGQITLPILSLDSTKTYWESVGGDSSDEEILTKAGSSPSEMIYNLSVHQYLIATSIAGKESHVVEISSVNKDGADFKDVVSGATYDNHKNGTSFNIGEVTIAVNEVEINEEWVNLSLTGSTDYADRIITKAGLTIMMPVINATNSNTNTTPYIKLNSSDTQNTYDLIFKEDDKTEGTTESTTTDGLHFKVALGVTSNKVTVSSVNATLLDVPNTEVDTGTLPSDQATILIYYQAGDQDTLDIEYHGGESYGNFYIGGGSSVIKAAETSSEAKAGAKISVGATKLASEVVGEEKTQNMVLVGGPCANRAAAIIMGNPLDCTAGYEAGKGIIQLFENNGSVAMLVAGYTAEDTRTSTSVVANYEDYDLTGEKMEVSTATKTVTEADATIPTADDIIMDDTTDKEYIE